MAKNIIIIGSSGAIGSSFLKYYENENTDNVIYSLSRKPNASPSDKIINVPVDIEDESSISSASNVCKENGPFDLILVTTGILSDETISPEKSLRHFDRESIGKIFSINTFGPALISKYFVPLLKKDSPSFFGFLSARVGSISDNRIGGWYSYRASKAALNQLIKTASIEMKIKNKNAIFVALHPGTVDSDLSRPFQKSNLKIQSPKESAINLMKIIKNLKPTETGKFFNWDGLELPW